MGRPVVHWEFWSEDPAKVSRFCQQVFDWKIQPLPELDYNLVETGGTGGINGGIMKPKRGRRPGGKIIVEKQEVPGVGQLSLFEDPEGRVLGRWKREE